MSCALIGPKADEADSGPKLPKPRLLLPSNRKSLVKATPRFHRACAKTRTSRLSIGATLPHTIAHPPLPPQRALRREPAVPQYVLEVRRPPPGERGNRAATALPQWPARRQAHRGSVSPQPDLAAPRPTPRQNGFVRLPTKVENSAHGKDRSASPPALRRSDDLRQVEAARLRRTSRRLRCMGERVPAQCERLLALRCSLLLKTHQV
jgi:hypothetical protein